MVVAPSTVEVVRCAGGWMFDRSMAGWDVTVLVAEEADARPLRILGARSAGLAAALAAPLPAPAPRALAVHADLHAADGRVRRLVLDALTDGVEEIWLWGDQGTKTLGGDGLVRHRLSAAARAFKAQALVAAALPRESGDGSELFVRGEAALRTA